MAKQPIKSIDTELERLKRELERNEELMREAAIKYEDLVAAKEALTSAINARRNSGPENREGNRSSGIS
jgi:hypothetical protein